MGRWDDNADTHRWTNRETTFWVPSSCHPSSPRPRSYTPLLDTRMMSIPCRQPGSQPFLLHSELLKPSPNNRRILTHVSGLPPPFLQPSFQPAAIAGFPGFGWPWLSSSDAQNKLCLLHLLSGYHILEKQLQVLMPLFSSFLSVFWYNTSPWVSRYELDMVFSCTFNTEKYKIYFLYSSDVNSITVCEVKM